MKKLILFILLVLTLNLHSEESGELASFGYPAKAWYGPYGLLYVQYMDHIIVVKGYSYALVQDPQYYFYSPEKECVLIDMDRYQLDHPSF
jgi:hypothetical protein